MRFESLANTIEKIGEVTPEMLEQRDADILAMIETIAKDIPAAQQTFESLSPESQTRVKTEVLKYLETKYGPTWLEHVERVLGSGVAVLGILACVAVLRGTVDAQLPDVIISTFVSGAFAGMFWKPTFKRMRNRSAVRNFFDTQKLKPEEND